MTMKILCCLLKDSATLEMMSLARVVNDGYNYIPNPYFKEAKLRCQFSGIYHFDEIFLKHLIEIREWVNFGMVISSAYRHESHPIESAKILQGKKPGSHSLGRAVDIKIRGNKCYSLIEQCIRNRRYACSQRRVQHWR